MRTRLRGERKFGLHAVLAGLVLLRVTLTAILIHVIWFYTARQNVADVVGQLNRQIVGSLQHEARGTAWSVQETDRSIFFQEAIKPTDEAKREFIFLALSRSHPTLSWMALGFPDGAFFGTLRAAGDEIDKVEVKRDAENKNSAAVGRHLHARARRRIISRAQGKGLPGSLEFAHCDRCLADGDVFAAI
jgi:hypothetical protein